MAEPRPPIRVELDWRGELAFAAQTGEQRLVIDSAGVAGPSPVQALVLGLAGCMSIDLVHILGKGRHTVEAVHASLTGLRSEAEPRRLTRVELHFTVTADAPAASIDRAIQLSREKYCSVWHSLRQDIDFQVTYDLRARVAPPGAGSPAPGPGSPAL